jgi:hypothetical protein
MPQFDIYLYLYIFIIFSYLFFFLYFFLQLFILPYFWQILYMRYLKQQYNLFFNLLNKIQLIYLKNLNLDLVNYSGKIFEVSYVKYNCFFEILDYLNITFFKFIKKND